MKGRNSPVVVHVVFPLLTFLMRWASSSVFGGCWGFKSLLRSHLTSQEMGIDLYFAFSIALFAFALSESTRSRSNYASCMPCNRYR